MILSWQEVDIKTNKLRVFFNNVVEMGFYV